MEKHKSEFKTTELSSDLKQMLDETCKLRKAFLELKTENTTLIQMLNIKKQKLNKSQDRCKKMLTTFSEKYKSIVEINVALKNEINHLRLVINDLQSETENQVTELKNKDEICKKLEEELEIVRLELHLQAANYNENIEKIQERNRLERDREISQYQSKLNTANAEFEKLKERLKQQTEQQNKTHQRFNHPALCNDESNTKNGKCLSRVRKKQNSRWPNLDITTSQGVPEIRQSSKSEDSTIIVVEQSSTKKKKLFSLDNENIVDFEAS